METAAVVQYEAGSGGISLASIGWLRFRQDQPLPHNGNFSVYNVLSLRFWEGGYQQ